jgi:hypothetical protein
VSYRRQIRKAIVSGFALLAWRTKIPVTGEMVLTS